MSNEFSQTAPAVAVGALPWATVLVVILAVAKWGFGMNISAWWVFAPYWLPFLIGLAILFVVLVGFAIFVLGIKSFVGNGRRRFRQGNITPRRAF